MTATNPTNHTRAAVTTEANPLAELLVKPMQQYNLALEPQGDEAAWRLATHCAKMRLCGCVTPEDAYLRILAGRAIGLPAMASVQAIIPIYRKKTDDFALTMFVKTKVALCLSRPDVIEYVRLTESTDQKATWVGKRIGGLEQSYSFTWDEAVKAGLVGRGKGGGEENNYDRHPRPMLAWRAGGRLLDLIAGDVLNGIASYEDETEEIERGEIRGVEAVRSSVPMRNWAAEAEAIKAEMTAAVATKDATTMKIVRGKFKVLEGEAPALVVEDLKAFYNALKSGAAPAKAPAPAAAAAAPVSAPTAAAPPAPGATATDAASPPAAPYLPPNQRSDAYEGPDQPPAGAS